MEVEPIWAEYATYDDDGFVDGIRDDAPEEVKEVFREYQQRNRRDGESKTPILKY